MWRTKHFSSVAFLISCFLGIHLSACTTMQDFLKTTSPEIDNHAAYQTLEKNVPLTARRYVDIPYQWGADPDNSNRTDCSHLVSAIVRNSLSGSRFRLCSPYFTTDSIRKNSFSVKKADVQVGDIIFFKNENGFSGSNHAGIVTKKQGNVIFFIHASTSDGVIETSTASKSWREYWQDRLHSYRRWKKSVFVRI